MKTTDYVIRAFNRNQDDPTSNQAPHVEIGVVDGTGGFTCWRASSPIIMSQRGAVLSLVGLAYLTHRAQGSEFTIKIDDSIEEFDL